MRIDFFFARWLLAAAVSLCLAACASMPSVVKPSLDLAGATGRWTARDGSEFPCRAWLPKGQEPVGVVVGVHGLSGATCDFQNLGESMRRHGLAFYAYELRGQGNDPVKERIGDIPSARWWIEDLRSFDSLVRQRHPGQPVIWLGESLGSLIICSTVAHRPPKERPGALVLVSPIPGFDERVGLIRRQFVGLSAMADPTLRIPLSDWARQDTQAWQMTGQSNHLDQLTRTPWAVDAFTLRFYHQLAIMIGRMEPQAGGIEQPTLVLHAGHDVFARGDLVKDFVARLPHGEVHCYPDSHHLLFYDRDREQVVRDITHWCLERSAEIPKRKSS